MKEKNLKNRQEDSPKKPAAEESPVPLEKDPSGLPAEAEQKLKDLADQALRLRADFDNTKKRLEREKIEAIRYANERLLVEVLPIVDNLDRALASLGEGHDPAKVKEGLEIAQSELHKVLELHGVERVKCLGADFDPKVHEAVSVVESGTAREGEILEEIQRGYLLNGRLIRPSRVRIAQQKTQEGGMTDGK